MRTAILDDVIRRIDGRQLTRAEMREREERRRHAAQLVSEIAAQPRCDRIGRNQHRQFG